LANGFTERFFYGLIANGWLSFPRTGRSNAVFRANKSPIAFTNENQE